MKRIIHSYPLGDMLVTFVEETQNGRCGMMLYPAALAQKVSLEGNWQVDSLVQVKVVGDSYPVGFSHGHTMRNSQTVEKLRFVTQRTRERPMAAADREEEEASGGRSLFVIETILESAELSALHRVIYRRGTPFISVETEITNISPEPVKVEMLSSFSVCALSPFDSVERMEDLNFYRLRSKWSAEGRLTKESFLSLQMEPSWQRYGVQSIRFGEIGSMPVREFFPWAAVEDERYHVMTGAQLYHNGSWQMELYDRDDKAALSGGLADREFGHWLKILRPGEHFLSPKSVLSTCVGDVDELSFRLTCAQKEGRRHVPDVEKNLPVLFNEFCTTWGNPTQENIERIAEAIRGKGFTYCVIDAGWYSIGEGDWNGDMGDWNINQDRFPGGFFGAVSAIRKAGMIPGLWFEMECVGQATEGFGKTNWQLTRDGVPIQTGLRRFWDMRNPEVIEYLSDKVIGILKEYGFGYLKVDYNDNIGIGCDGAESPGEGLRQAVEATGQFFRKIKEALPDLVIENCSSGGHRLEPSMQAVCSMSSFSDAHECLHIPVVAANVQRAVLPEQSQIWAVVRATDDDKRLYYSMTNTFLGRMCLSGDVCDLTKEQWKIVNEGVRFYQKAAAVIRDGKSRRQGMEELNYGRPEGWQAVVREGTEKAKGRLLVVVHRFRKAKTNADGAWKILLPKTAGAWKLTDFYGRECVHMEVEKGVTADSLHISGMEEMEAAAALLTAGESQAVY